MMNIPVHPNTIYIPMVQTGCLTAEYDSTYPIHLNGIINQHEFQESIKRINLTLSSHKTFIIVCWIIFALTLIIGIGCFVIGGVMATKFWTVFYVLLGLGIFLTTFGSIFFAIGFCVIYSKRALRMREAVAQESMKYSSRSPTPCSWRLDTSRTWFGPYGYNNNNQMFYQLAIDIGSNVLQESANQVRYSNKVAPEPTSYFGRQDYFAPPAYSVQTAGFCSRCGVARQDLTAKYCSSCGHSFNT
ncbi:unnamed protein product [Rotaria sp. Silwood2]|nr:unnamed protein product [Rotaria sp. Silwood2]CAF4500288.1 unnamed protein product [Rotaria sp. Silwood2]